QRPGGWGRQGMRACRRRPEEPPLPAQVATPVALVPPDGGSRRPGLRALKKMGLTEDEDVRAMLRGSRLCKIRSRTWHKERLYRLQEDGLSVWFQRRIPRAPSQHIFFVQHIEAVREGHQSEGLRRFGGAFPPARCLTIAFKGRRKNLDLAAATAEEAQCWVRGLAKLRARLDAMSQRDAHTWIHAYLHRADSDQDSKMSFKEIKNLLRMVNVDMNDMYAYRLFKECDHSNNERLEGAEIEEFLRRLLKRPELEEIFHRYSGEDRVLSAPELLEFLEDQGEDGVTLAHAQKLIHTYELNETAKQHELMTLDGFMMYLLSPEGAALDPAHTCVFQDMDQPLPHYFISSSHNTYLTDSQIGGLSSTEAYVRAFAQGCRCVELDCWEGPGGEPIIYHGHTLTSKILFRDVVQTVRDHAFTLSPYPVILSLENHCGLEQQAVMARHLRTILGDALVTEALGAQTPEELPSPEQLKGRVLVKGKKLPAARSEDGRILSDQEEEEEEEEEEAEAAEQRTEGAKQISPELSALVVYCCATRLRTLHPNPVPPQPCQVSSLNERKAKKLIREAGNSFVRHNARQLTRVYPLGLRMNSANYSPQEMWNSGCQLVALNFQTPGYEMDLNAGRFLVNGQCGYILKPACLRQPDTTFDPECPGPPRTTLTIQVLTAQQLPKLNTEKPNSIVDPLVRVEIHGVPADCARKETNYVLNNGFNPRWGQTLQFQLRAPELVLVRFVVEDYDTTSPNDFVGQFTLPLNSLKQGYRHIHLLSKDGASLSPATLFVHIRVQRF
uniref:Phosphoinositide phospholipase C n=1 Tax=Ursus americanus TaxID=9643 RepID=A0A452SFW6_URSAM